MDKRLPHWKTPTGHQQVLINGEQSSATEVTSGIPPGPVLTPLLFLCFINDLPKNILSTVRFFADNVILYTTVNSKEDCYQLQKDLNTLKRWANNWKMTLELLIRKLLSFHNILCIITPYKK